MALPTVCKNQRNALAKVLSRILATDAQANTDVAPGTGPESGLRRLTIWQATTTPATAGTDMNANDLVLDLENDDVYRYISSNTYINMTAES